MQMKPEPKVDFQGGGVMSVTRQWNPAPSGTPGCMFFINEGFTFILVSHKLKDTLASVETLPGHPGGHAPGGGSVAGPSEAFPLRLQGPCQSGAFDQSM